MKVISSSTGGGDVFPLDAAVDMEELKNKHSGQRGAVIGTGCSMEGLDLSVLDSYDFTIGMNEAPKLYGSDYLMILDERAIAKVMNYLEPHHGKMTPVVARKIVAILMERPPYSKEGVCADEAFGKCGRMYSFRTSTRISNSELCCVGGALSGALSLAKWMGCAELHLYGCDFYRYRDRKYAYGLNDPPEELMIPVDKFEERFTTPAMQGMVMGIEGHMETWAGMSVTNANPLSELRCFKGGRTDEW